MCLVELDGFEKSPDRLVELAEVVVRHAEVEIRLGAVRVVLDDEQATVDIVTPPAARMQGPVSHAGCSSAPGRGDRIRARRPLATNKQFSS
jgi:hypothetical protein